MFTAIVESDLHVGNQFGLANPRLVGDAYHAMAQTLFDWRVTVIEAVGPIDMHICPAETIDGTGRKSTLEQWTTDLEEQAIHAAELLCMWDCPDYRICYGTKYHTGDESKSEHKVVDKIKLLYNRRADIKATQRLEINGVKINARHHVGASSTPNGKWSQLAKTVTQDYLRGCYRNYPGADLYFRAHTHEYAMVGNDMYTAYNNPAMQWPLGEYGLKMDRVWYTMGLTKLTIQDDGEWTVKPYILRVKLPEENYAVVATSD